MDCVKTPAPCQLKELVMNLESEVGVLLDVTRGLESLQREVNDCVSPVPVEACTGANAGNPDLYQRIRYCRATVADCAERIRTATAQF